MPSSIAALLQSLMAWWRRLLARRRGVVRDPWLEDFLATIFARYHFTPEAATWLRLTVTVEVVDRTSDHGGGYWFASERLVHLYTAQHEAAVHELAHAWWEYRRTSWSMTDTLGLGYALLEAVHQCAAGLVAELTPSDIRISLRDMPDSDLPFPVTQALCYVYTYGNSLTGFPGMGGNDHEIFAGLASGCMGDVSLLPPYLRRFYVGLFIGAEE